MLRINTIEPTVFFIKDKAELLQAVDIVIENTSETVEVSVDIKFDSKERHTVLGKVGQGEDTYRVYVPDICEPISVEFILKANGKVQDRRKMTWSPQRHWQVCMIPIAHHDFGYTETIENVLHRYDGFYDDILCFCEETEDWSEESKFRYMVEETWSIQHFIENRPKEIALLVYCLIEMRLRQANIKVSGQRVLENFAKLSLIESIFNDGTKVFRIAQETPFQRQVLFIFGYPSPQTYFGEKVPI